MQLREERGGEEEQGVKGLGLARLGAAGARSRPGQTVQVAG
jgi:hypothetical protein